MSVNCLIIFVQWGNCTHFCLFAENLRFDVFCDAIRSLFGPDIRSQDLKAIFRKISTNPDAKVDWSEVQNKSIILG